MLATKRGGLAVLFQSHFSKEATTEMRFVYLIMVLAVTATTLVALIEGLVETCRFQRNHVANETLTYKNPEFTTRGGCMTKRFGFLLGLTPEECMLCRRVLLSVVLGMMIGFERRRADRPAGVRTMALVSLGSCIFTVDSMFAFSSSPDSWDSSRVAAAIPSGVGFLGAGLIFKQPPRNPTDHHEVHGLTTASSVWLSAAAGIAAGGGLYVIGTFATMVMIIVLRFGPRLPIEDSASHDSFGRDEEQPRKADHSSERARLVQEESKTESSSDNYGGVLPLRSKASLRE